MKEVLIGRLEVRSMLKIFRTIYNLSGDSKKKIHISFFLQFIDTFLSFVPIGALLMFFRAYLTNSLTPNYPWITFGIILSSVIIRSLSRYYMDKSQMTTIYEIFYGERLKTANHLKKVNMGFFTENNIGKVTTNLVNGITFIEEQCMGSLIYIFTAVVNLIFLTITLTIVRWELGLIFVLTILIVYLIMIPYRKALVKYSEKHNYSDVELTGAVIEYIKNISVIKSFKLLGKHKRTSDAYVVKRKIDLDGEKLHLPYLTAASVVMGISMGIMIFSVVYGSENIPIYMSLVLCIFPLYVFRSLEGIVLKLAGISIANDSLQNVQNLYDEKELEIRGDEKPVDSSIEFKDVEFAYEKRNVIDKISFKLEKNTMTALVGLSGSGKTTLVNLIPRFYEFQKGSILIGGVDVRDMSQETLYKNISMVFQNVYLFKDTIYNNIVFGNEKATKDDVIEACKKAKCYDFITLLPNGFDTMVGEAGLNLSGGERQRVSIARAILKDAPIILLDEATASVDPDNELEIQEAINALVENKTLLVIAHKFSCVRNADKILVLSDGKLVEEGTHEELLLKDDIYASLWRKRLNSKSWKIENS